MNKSIDYLVKDYEGFREDLIEGLKLRMPFYTDFSEYDLGIVLIELFAHGLDVTNYYVDVAANESILATARQKERVAYHCESLGYSMVNSVPSRVYVVFELAMILTTDYTIPSGTQLTTVDGVIFETLGDSTIPKGCLGTERDEHGVYTYRVPCMQGYSVLEESIGMSTGAADMQFKLSNADPVDSSILLLVHNGNDYEQWNKVDSFIDSGSTSKDFRVKYDSKGFASIVFGNGSSGAIPPVNSHAILCSYKVGGGTQGNIAPDTLVNMVNPLSYVKSVTNPYTPYVQGSDSETIESAKLNAIRSYRTLDRVVTLQDCSDMCILYGAYSANSIRNDAQGRVDVVVIPASKEQLTPDDKAYFTDMLSKKGLFGVTFNVMSHSTVPINLSITVRLKDTYSPEGVEPDLINCITNHFKVENFSLQVSEWILGDLEEELRDIDGVKSVRIVSPSDIVDIDEYSIPSLGNVSLTIKYGNNDTWLRKW